MLDFLYWLVISPIELIVEVTYSVLHRVFNNPGFAIIAVSIVIQTLVSPLYKRADSIQDEERRRQKQMAPIIDHIKKTFRGEEKYMMLSAYYTEQNYKSWYAIKSSLSLLLQVPFFIAAYHFLSNLSELSGVPFLFINDLKQPDMAFSIAGITINVLPILMTLINIASGVLYTKGFPIKEKIQVYGIALVFLVLLYNRPSGLVLYWTMNNVYSLVRNALKSIMPVQKEKHDSEENGVGTGFSAVQFWTALLLTFFTGALIPLNIVNASAVEFINAKHGPIYLTVSNLTVFAGLFLVWGSIFWALMTDRVKALFTSVLFALAGISILDYMAFGTNLGRMSPFFEYDTGVAFASGTMILNLFLVLACSVVLIFLLHKKTKWATTLLKILILSTVIICVINLQSVVKQVRFYNKTQMASDNGSDEKILKLSKNGTNVVLLMMDRAISGYIPYIFKENPEIQKMYEGFTYYPNTLSFGVCTYVGAPAVYGGYEYTPQKLNERTDTAMMDKNDEALLLMPRIFADNGFDACVCDPPFAGTYSMTPDISIFDDYENIRAYITEGRYTYKYFEDVAPSFQKKQENLVVYHSIMKCMPVCLQPILYNDGKYMSKMDIPISMGFLDSYTVLLSLPELTEVTDDDTSHFIDFHNNTTHDTALLQIPEYKPEEGVRNKNIDYESYYNAEDFTIDGVTLKIKNVEQAGSYQSTVAAMRELGVWFDYLRENDCWDNTRIIIVADHGYYHPNFDYMQLGNGVNVEKYNPLLMVKDFNSESFSVSDQFMTNADVPVIAFEGLIDDPVNPATGESVNDDNKKENQIITSLDHWGIQKADSPALYEDSKDSWYSVTPGDIFDVNNWQVLDE